MNRVVTKTALVLLLFLLLAVLVNVAVSHRSLSPAKPLRKKISDPVQGTVSIQENETHFPVTQTPCPVRPDLNEIEGVTVVCGTITVPENYEQPAGNQVDLAYAVLKSTSLSPAPDPVIYLHGGPGAAELRSLEKMSERFASIRQSRDVVIFDQRGTGFSNQPLTCEVEYATQQDAAREAFREYAGSGNLADEDSAINMAIFKVCLDRFQEIGTDLSQYNTVNNARDVANLAAALDYDTFNLYGFSYGTQLALEVMRQHPQKLRSVILDSVAPADIKLYENFGQPNVEALTSLFAFCAADEACNEVYPDLQNRYQALLTRLSEDPLMASDGSLLTAANLVEALRQSDIRPGLGAYIPLLIWELEQGKLDTLMAIQNNELPPPVPADLDPLFLRYAGQAVPPDAALLVDTAMELRQQAQQLNATAERLLQRGDEQIVSGSLQDSLAARFDYLFHEAMNAEPFDRRLALNQAYLTLPLKGTSVENVQTFISENFQGFSANRLMSVAEAMSDEDVEALAMIIFGKARDYAYFFDVSLALSLYVCQEHVPYNTIEGAVDTFAELEIPQLGRGKFRTVELLLGSCQLFPTDLAADGFHEAVVSDIPALILLGTADTQTATSWGEHVAENLENSEVVRFPESGHGAIRYSQCARDIGAAFFNNPASEIDTACTEDLLPLFVLPAEE